MGTESQPEQPAYNSENSDKNKQLHGVQTGLERQQNN